MQDMLATSMWVNHAILMPWHEARPAT